MSFWTQNSVNFIDTTACDALLNTIKELQSQGITFAFARVRDEVRERMRLGGIEAVVGSSNFYERVTDGVRAWQQREKLDRFVRGIKPASWLAPDRGAGRTSAAGSFHIGHIVQPMQSLREPRRQTVGRHPLGELG